jgi:hypothetical protein
MKRGRKKKKKKVMEREKAKEWRMQAKEMKY